MTEHSKPKYANQISLGNVIQIAVLLVTVSASYALQSARIENNGDDIREMRTAADNLQGRVRLLETQQARSDEKFTNILTYLARIDGRLERIEQGR